jgi:hypothetical protein
MIPDDFRVLRYNAKLVATKFSAQTGVADSHKRSRELPWKILPLSTLIAACQSTISGKRVGSETGLYLDNRRKQVKSSSGLCGELCVTSVPW